MADELENASEALLSFKNGIMVKEEPMDEEFGPASLGLQRVNQTSSKSKKTQPPPTSTPPLNRRGMPMRIRKKNPLFFDDEPAAPDSVVPRSMLKATRVKTPSSAKSSPVKRTRRSTPVKQQEKPPTPPPLEAPATPTKSDKVETPITTGNGNDRKLGQKIGMKLRNLLKLPKAHKWVCYEWFYSNLDSSLLGGENDFTICLKESFPQLKTFMLTRVEWCKMRRMMGKPRRCSQAFFEEERRELEKKRNKIRQLQQRKPMDLNSCKDLPTEIPLQLVIGTKVTARLRTPQDGLFTGSIDGFDTSNNTYRITFERPGLGTHSIPDFEVLSNEPVDTISVTSMVHALRPNARLSHAENVHLSESVDDPSQLTEAPNGFPVSALESIVRLNKILDIKRTRVATLRDMNIEAERKMSFSETLADEFVRKYASCIIELEHINISLGKLLATVQSHCQELLPDMNMAAMLTPNYLRNQCLEEAKAMVDRFSCSVSHSPLLDLVIELTALMLQVKSLSESDRNTYEVEVLTASMDAIKKKLSPENRTVFESNVEVHMRHIQAGLNGEIGTFSMFMATRP